MSRAVSHELHTLVGPCLQLQTRYNKEIERLTPAVARAVYSYEKEPISGFTVSPEPSTAIRLQQELVMCQSVKNVSKPLVEHFTTKDFHSMIRKETDLTNSSLSSLVSNFSCQVPSELRPDI